MNKFNNTEVALVMTCQPGLGETLDWMIKNLGKYETLHIVHWKEEYFYFEVRDSRKELFPSVSSMRFGLTVNMKLGSIVWNHSNEYQRGNCFVRSPKWKGLPEVKQWATSAIHRYKDLKRAKQKKSSDLVFI